MPRHFTVGHDRAEIDFAPRRRMASSRCRPLRVQNPSRDDSDYGIEKTLRLINNVGQAFVMGVGQVSLKRSGFDSINQQNRDENGMAAQWFFIRTHHASASFLDWCP